MVKYIGGIDPMTDKEYFEFTKPLGDETRLGINFEENELVRINRITELEDLRNEIGDDGIWFKPCKTKNSDINDIVDVLRKTGQITSYAPIRERIEKDVEATDKGLNLESELVDEELAKKSMSIRTNLIVPTVFNDADNIKYADCKMQINKASGKVSRNKPFDAIDACPDLATTVVAKDKMLCWCEVDNGNVYLCIKYVPEDGVPGLISKRFLKSDVSDGVVYSIIGNRKNVTEVIVKTIYKAIKKNLPNMEETATPIEGTCSLMDAYRFVVEYGITRATEGVKNFKIREYSGKKVVCIDGKQTLQQVLDAGDFNIKYLDFMKALAVGLTEDSREFCRRSGGRYTCYNEHFYAIIVHDDLLNEV